MYDVDNLTPRDGKHHANARTRVVAQEAPNSGGGDRGRGGRANHLSNVYDSKDVYLFRRTNIFMMYLFRRNVSVFKCIILMPHFRLHVSFSKDEATRHNFLVSSPQCIETEEIDSGAKSGPIFPD